MRVRIKLFAILREKAGLSELDLELPQAATVAQAKEALGRQLPELGTLLHRVAFAVNRSYCDLSTELHDEDELAALPPVTGG